MSNSHDVHVFANGRRYRAPFSVRMVVDADGGPPQAQVRDGRDRLVERLSPTAEEMLDDRSHTVTALATRAALRAESLTRTSEEGRLALTAASAAPVAVAVARETPARPKQFLVFGILSPSSAPSSV